jgi:pilus assembly protein Flp/PilA
MRKIFKAFVRDERGVSAMEYAVLAGIIVVALVAVGSTFTTGFTSVFNTLFTNVNSAQTNAKG